MITKELQDKYPELVSLIKNTESMDNKEREYWFDLLNGNVKNDPECMTDEQANRLFNILETERVGILKLEDYFRNAMQKLITKTI